MQGQWTKFRMNFLCVLFKMLNHGLCIVQELNIVYDRRAYLKEKEGVVCKQPKGICFCKQRIFCGSVSKNNYYD